MKTFPFPRVAWCLGLLAAAVGAASVARASSARDEIVQLRPFAVNVSPLGTVAVMFSYIGEDYGDGQAAIDTVFITDVPPGSPGEKANLRKDDELLLLNGKTIRGLTLGEFAALIRSERSKGDLKWKVSRGLAKVTFYTKFNGRTDRDAHELDDKDEPAQATAAAGGETGAKSSAIERMAPFNVNESVSVAIDVAFVMARDRLFAELDDPIDTAKVIDVQGDLHSRRQGLHVGDVLLSLNGTPIKGLTLRKLGAMVVEQKKQGLNWEVRRDLSVITRRYDGRWIRPLPVPLAAAAAAKPPSSP